MRLSLPNLCLIRFVFSQGWEARAMTVAEMWGRGQGGLRCGESLGTERRRRVLCKRKFCHCPALGLFSTFPWKTCLTCFKKKNTCSNWKL